MHGNGSNRRPGRGPKVVSDRGAFGVRRMSPLGQYLPKSHVCVTSVQPPITDSCRTSQHFAFGPRGDMYAVWQGAPPMA
jgi:hypothetical protein